MKQKKDFQRFDVQSLKSIPITSVVGMFDKLKRRGCVQYAHCPWHDDEHASLALYEKGTENHCHCFACGKGGDTISYVMQHEGLDFKAACQLLGQQFGVGMVTSEAKLPVQLHRPRVEERPVDYTHLPSDWLQSRVGVNNSFSQCMMRLFDSYLMEWLTEEYQLGCYDWRGYEDCVLFPSIDMQGRIHNIKLQHYCTDWDDPDFFHCKRDVLCWMGSVLASQGVVAKDAVFDNNCLFGAHLLQRYPSSMVALVESPKNALLGAAQNPAYVWVAAGSKSLLNRRTLEPLRERNVMVFPDRDAIRDWTELLASMRSIANFVVSDFCERYAPADAPKFDIADYIIASRIKSL